MAIETELLPRLEYALSQKGTIYSKTLTLAAEALSNAIILPVSEIHAIGVQTSTGSDLSIYATMASPSEIEAETAIWDLWDGTSLI